ncbi:uncharacterized protein LOC123202312 [Mangifera indica]|uniref:uncharacterized protein LOC123202312 n=1 Tax=Mangifera indica TaxID=29780 RepID=UPI001CFB5EBF|nr:uncharacterized protein LOC123202312 [Mangifera indica]
MSTTPKKDSGCFSCILRRILCHGSPQAYPSDQIAGPQEVEFNEPKKEFRPQAQGAPGVVARLMGLDSLPEASCVFKGRAPDSVTRSKSVNFMDYLLQLDLAQAHQHRKVRASVSFREVPTLLHQQNPELFTLYLDEVDEKKKRESKVRKSGEKFGELKQKKEEKSKKNKERLGMNKKEKESKSKKFSKFINEPRRISAKNHSNNSNSKKYGESGATVKKKLSVKRMNQIDDVLAKPRLTKSKDKQSVEAKMAAEFSSENSSPISVLDINEFSIYDYHRSSEDPRCKDLHFERKSSVKSICTPANSKRILRNDDPKLRVVKKKENEWLDDQMTDYYKEMVAKLCLITDECIIQCNWVPEKELNFEEICMQIGEHILDTSIKQAVDELEGFN